MKKSRSALAFLLAFVLVAAMASLVACSSGGSQQSESKETLSVSSEPSADQPSSSVPAAAANISMDPFWVMIVGDDRREGTIGLHGQYADGKGRSDTLMIARVDPANNKLTLVTVPRDTQAEYDGQRCKLNETYHQGGIEALKKAVADLTGVEVDHYLITTFVSFENLVDDMGGLTVNVPINNAMQDIVTGEWQEFPAGEQTLDGKQALVFARERHAYEMYNGNLQEAYRQSNDRYILSTMIRQILANRETVSDNVKALYKNFETDWDVEDIAAYAEYFSANRDNLNIIDGTGPYEGDIDAETQLWLAYRDEDTWHKVIDVVNSGGDPKEVVPILSAL